MTPPAPEIAAEGLVPAPREEVFDFLADLETHWELADRFVEVVQLDGPAGARDGGRVRMRGPLGLRRTAETRVEVADRPRLLCGSAQIGGRTHSTVRWELCEASEATRVRLSARIDSASALDWLALSLGGRNWIERRFAGILQTLAAVFSHPASFDAWRLSAQSRVTRRESEVPARVRATVDSRTPRR